jgi:predicted nucleic acid-binding protein
MLFDTDVLIWILRGNLRAARIVDAAAQRHLSVVNYLELLQGARDRREVKVIRDFIADLAFDLLPLTENVGHRAIVYMEQYGLRVAMSLADALVAATAVEAHLPLCTANRKHYKLIADLDIRSFRP